MFRLLVAFGAIASLAGCVAAPGYGYGYGYGADAPVGYGSGYGYGGYDTYDTGAYPYYYGGAPVVGGISIWGGGGDDYYRGNDYRGGDRGRPDRWHGGGGANNAPGRNQGGGMSVSRDQIVPYRGGGAQQMQPRRSSPAPVRGDNRGWGRNERWSN